MSLSHDEKKEIIVKAAREVFNKFGYKKTTMEDIATSLYRAKSSIYYYFNSKEDIFREVVELETKRAKAIIHAAVSRETTPEAKLRAHFKTIISFIREAISYYNLMQEEMIDLLDYSNDLKKKHKRDTIQLIAGILREGVSDGSFDIGDIDGTAESVMFAFDGLYHPFFPGEEEITDTQFDNLFDLILNGIRPRLQ